MSPKVVDVTSTGDKASTWRREAEAGEVAVAVVRARDLDFEVGNVRVEAEADDGVGPIPGHRCRVFLDGKPFPVRSLELRIAVGEVVSCRIEFYPVRSSEPGG